MPCLPHPNSFYKAIIMFFVTINLAVSILSVSLSDLVSYRISNNSDEVRQGLFNLIIDKSSSSSLWINISRVFSIVSSAAIGINFILSFILIVIKENRKRIIRLFYFIIFLSLISLISSLIAWLTFIGKTLNILDKKSLSYGSCLPVAALSASLSLVSLILSIGNPYSKRNFCTRIKEKRKPVQRDSGQFFNVPPLFFSHNYLHGHSNKGFCSGNVHQDDTISSNSKKGIQTARRPMRTLDGWWNEIPYSHSSCGKTFVLENQQNPTTIQQQLPISPFLPFSYVGNNCEELIEGRRKEEFTENLS